MLMLFGTLLALVLLPMSLLLFPLFAWLILPTLIAFGAIYVGERIKHHEGLIPLHSH